MAGINRIIINVPVIKDDITEESETFNLNLIISPSLDNIVTRGNISTANATITDDTSKNY